MNEWPSEDANGTPQAAPNPAPADAAAPCDCDRSGGLVLRRTIIIPNSRGLHARAAAKLVALAERFSACVNVIRAGQSVPACSIMGLMMLGAGQGSEVMVEAEGWDARDALDAIAGLIEAGFHEE